MIVDTCGYVYSFGAATDGQLGYIVDTSSKSFLDFGIVADGIITQLIPQKIKSFYENGIQIEDIVCGSNFTFATSRDNKVYSFGGNQQQQLCRNKKI